MNSTAALPARIARVGEAPIRGKRARQRRITTREGAAWTWNPPSARRTRSVRPDRRAHANKRATFSIAALARSTSRAQGQPGASLETVSPVPDSSAFIALKHLAPRDVVPRSLSSGSRERCHGASQRCPARALGAPNRRSPMSCTSPRRRARAHVRNGMTKVGARSRAHLVASQPVSEAGSPGARVGSEEETITTMTMTATMTAQPILRGVMWRPPKGWNTVPAPKALGLPRPTEFAGSS